MDEFLAWKTRDAAEELLEERRRIAVHLMPPGHNPESNMPIRDEFAAAAAGVVIGGEDRHKRLLLEKSVMIQNAFTAAAVCVLKALSNPLNVTQRTTRPSSLPLVVDENDDDLPAIVKDCKRLEESRRTAFDRTHNNKAYISKTCGSAGKKRADIDTGDEELDLTALDFCPDAVLSSSDSKDILSLTAVKAENLSQATTSSNNSNVPIQDASIVTSANARSSSVLTNSEKGPKFTRNTPAASAAALDFRLNSSRAILCAAGNLVFEALTPNPCRSSIDTATQLDALSVPQNPAFKNPDSCKSELSNTSTGTGTGSVQVNMGTIVMEARLLSQRTISVVANAMRRASLRYLYRKTNAEQNSRNVDPNFLHIPNPYCLSPINSIKQTCRDERNSPVSFFDFEAWTDGYDSDEEHASAGVPFLPDISSLTVAWKENGLPHFLRILERGAGHAIFYDCYWLTRHGRMANLLHHIPSKYGPHLIVTIEPEVRKFCREFENGLVRRLVYQPSERLRVVAYQGTPMQRKELRKRFFRSGDGLETSLWHVMVTSYLSLLEDFLHFSQVPLDCVILDDGVSWMAAANGDPLSALGSIWDNLFARNDQQIGLAGTQNIDNYWNFELHGDIPESIVKDGWVGLTCRHRIMTSSSMAIEVARGQELVPVSGLLGFVAPHFSDMVREDWDRSRITADGDSMAHFRNLVARSTVVHCTNDEEWKSLSQESQAIAALNGKLEVNLPMGPTIPEIVHADAFVSDGKIIFSRRSCLSWLGPLEHSWLRYELGKAKLQHILDAMKISNRHGHICEEICAASSTTSTGATGLVTGSLAYRLAIRCCRHFGSEQGLRQHITASHAPPGTWLCRTCGVDCISSYARTHHERSCGVPGGAVYINSDRDQGGLSMGALPSVSQNDLNKSAVGKKKAVRASPVHTANSCEKKDVDGSCRVPGYRGVWVNPTGKHFVKIAGTRLNHEGNEELLFFGSIDEAARKYDEIVKQEQKGTVELNFKQDGSRYVYDDIAPKANNGLGGSSNSVVPALSVINIKDLPPDVKPLLRDPRQTSRTGGNSKRHVYAYRGVCRQARKGHDRWQSQISFMGVNHYLGTFDSEWDAAAIYAWAHLILYGEEATRQAQNEGEEAAAAYEREQKDIASGKSPETYQKKKLKKAVTKKEIPSSGKKIVEEASTQGSNKTESASSTKKRKLAKESTGAAPEKKTKTNTKACKLEKEAIGSTVAKGVTKASVIAPKDTFEGIQDDDLLVLASRIIRAVKSTAYHLSDLKNSLPAIDPWFRPCCPANLHCKTVGGAMLRGLSPSVFGWDLEEFVASQNSDLDMTAIQMLAVEYDEDGVNEKFSAIIQGTACFLGLAGECLQRAYTNLGLGALALGGSIGKLDCHIGGVPGSCSESAACILYAPSDENDFWLFCLSDDDVVTLNGERLSVAHGKMPLCDEDICSVGARVFVFVLPSY